MADEIWRFFVEGVPDILLQVSNDGTILYINRVPSGLSATDVRGTTIYDHLAPAARPSVRRALADVFERGEMRYMDLPILFEDGTVRWYAASAGPVTFGERAVAATMVARDMTDQKSAELSLRESEMRNRTLVEHAPESIVVLDLDVGRFVDSNASACRLFGLTRQELLERELVALSPLVQPDGRRSDIAAAKYLDQVMAGEPPVFEWTYVGAGGQPIPCEVRLVRLPPSSRRLVRGSIIDISGQRRPGNQIAELQRLDTLGHVASGIAHDIDNILAIINAFTQMLLVALPEGGEARSHALEIRSAVERGTELTKQIVMFGRSMDPVRESVDLNAAVAHVAVMLGGLLGPGIRIDQQLHPRGAAVHANRGSVDQILSNLLLNARDAMPLGGRILIETSPVDGENSILLRITDAGTGMDEPTMARIFEPFFTTKPQGQGTGLGLSTTAMIVRQHGGRISVSSTIGEGTSFEIVLPSSPPEGGSIR